MTFLENRTTLKYKKDIEPHIINLFILGGWHSGPSSEKLYSPLVDHVIYRLFH